MNKVVKCILNFSLIALFVTIVSIATASGATFAVTTTNDTADVTPGDTLCADSAGACSLRAAISEANALAGPDTITIPAGAYTQTLVSANDDANAGGDWDITSDITINGASSATTFLQANAAAGVATERVLDIRAGATVVITDLTARNGRFAGTMAAATRGAGIENLGTLTLTNVIVRDNIVASTSGNPIAGGIYNANASLTLTNSTVTANTSSATATSAFGGGIASLGTSTIIITNSSVSGNNATSTFTNAFGFAAGVYLQDTFNATATGSQFNGNTGTGTGTAGSNGTGVRALSNLGAAVFNATNCSFSNNVGTGGTSNQGVGVQLFTSTSLAATLTATITDSTIANNTGNSVGLGINATATGGLLTANLIRSTVSGHTGAARGAGIILSNNLSTFTSPVTFTATNSTISTNSTVATGVGGGFAMEQITPAGQPAGAVTANFNFSTIANNTAGSSVGTGFGGGGLAILSGTANLKNTIVGDNTATGTGPDISGTINSQNYNHIENTAGATIGGTTTNNTTGDAGLVILANNGGPTQTHLPGVGSVVRNTIPNGTNDCGNVITNDQRGITRPQETGCEKGSVEVAATAAGVSVSGRVIGSADGRGLTGAVVRLTDQNGSIRTVVTGRLGSFTFADVEPGRTYLVSVASRRFSFAPRVIQVVDNVADLEFLPE